MKYLNVLSYKVEMTASFEMLASNIPGLQSCSKFYVIMCVYYGCYGMLWQKTCKKQNLPVMRKHQLLVYFYFFLYENICNWCFGNLFCISSMVIFGQVRESTLGISDSPPKKEMTCVHIIFFLGNCATCSFGSCLLHISL